MVHRYERTQRSYSPYTGRKPYVKYFDDDPFTRGKFTRRYEGGTRGTKRVRGERARVGRQQRYRSAVAQSVYGGPSRRNPRIRSSREFRARDSNRVKRARHVDRGYNKRKFGSAGYSGVGLPYNSQKAQRLGGADVTLTSGMMDRNYEPPITEDAFSGGKVPGSRAGKRKGQFGFTSAKRFDNRTRRTAQKRPGGSTSSGGYRKRPRY